MVPLAAYEEETVVEMVVMAKPVVREEEATAAVVMAAVAKAMGALVGVKVAAVRAAGCGTPTARTGKESWAKLAARSSRMDWRPIWGKVTSRRALLCPRHSTKGRPLRRPHTHQQWCRWWAPLQP